jgi:alkylhydroperoxidase/carboxymuconolactone decarboxylase family protein YurZ
LLHPHYDRWVLEDAYGRVLSRPFLPLKVRELCAVAALTVSGVPMQLRSHIMGAFHQGARHDEVDGIIRNMQILTDTKKIDDAIEILGTMDLK